MVRSVSIGSKPLHITEDIRKKLEAMNEHRKRIHPAAFLESGGLIPDLKPEQSEMALNTTKALARIAVDWIASHGLNQQE